MKEKIDYHKFTSCPDLILSLMSIYLSEWKHRDSLLWKQVFKFFYVTIIVLFLPNMADFLKIALPSILRPIYFPIVALILSGLFLYVSIGYCKRLSAVGATYQNIIDLLPDELARESISRSKASNHNMKTKKSIWSMRISMVVTSLMFAALIVLSCIMVYYYCPKNGAPAVIPDPYPPV